MGSLYLCVYSMPDDTAASNTSIFLFLAIKRPHGFTHACRHCKNIIILCNWSFKKHALSLMLWCETPVFQNTRRSRICWSSLWKRIEKFSQPFTVSMFSIFESRKEWILSQMCIYKNAYTYMYIFITHMHTKEEFYCFGEQACSQSLVGFFN